MPKVTGPADGEIITASFDGKSKTSFPSLKNTNYLVLLSIIGNDFCTDRYLKAIIENAAQNHKGNCFGHTTFLIADEIYWHNLKTQATISYKDAAELHIKAKSLGDSYFNENILSFLAPLSINIDEFLLEYKDATVDEKILVINQLALKENINFNIIRWQDWIAQDTENKLTNITPLYSSVDALKLAVEQSVEEFALRHSTTEKDMELWRLRSRDYLTEESPAIMLLAAHLGYNFVIYPGPILPPFKATKEFFIVKEHTTQIIHGESQKELCSHSSPDLRFHVKDPSRFVNWLEVNFKRSHPNKIPIHNPNKIPISLITDKTSFFQHQSTQTEGTIASKNKAELIAEIIYNPDEPPSCNVSKEKSLAVIEKLRISGVFEGITRALLQSSHSRNYQIAFIKALIDDFLDDIPLVISTSAIDPSLEETSQINLAAT